MANAGQNDNNSSENGDDQLVDVIIDTRYYDPEVWEKAEPTHHLAALTSYQGYPIFGMVTNKWQKRLEDGEDEWWVCLQLKVSRPSSLDQALLAKLSLLFS
jgi:hypothetical protein